MDKPLHERLMACVNPHDEGLIDAPAELLREAAAELSRMRTALEPAMRALAHIAIESDQDCAHANDPRAMTVIARLALAQARAAIAERALTAGSGNE